MPTTFDHIQRQLTDPDAATPVVPGSAEEHKLLQQAREIKAGSTGAETSLRRAAISTLPENGSGVVSPEAARHAGDVAVELATTQGHGAFEPVAPSTELMGQPPESHGNFEPPVAPEGNITAARLPQQPPVETPPPAPQPPVTV